MRVEVLNTGTELLLGSVINTHPRIFAEALWPLGLRLDRQVTVPDGGTGIRDALEEAFHRSEIVLMTGGLGPTTDDVSREAVAELLGVEMIHDESVIAAIKARFARRGLEMSERNLRQAQRPPEAIVLPNDNGTAPGLYFAPRPWRGKLTPHLFLLPGPPRELQPMVANGVVPILAKAVPERPTTEMRVFRIAGLGESNVEQIVGERLLALGIELGYCARPGEVDIRTIGAPAVLDQAAAIIEDALGPNIASRDQRTLEKVIVDALTTRRETLATAESCTGGFLSHRVTNVPGASTVFLQGFVTYANEAKTRALGVNPALIAAHGAVSEPVARAMAEGARQNSGADHALSTTGIAGPGGGTEEKPVGTVFIALATNLGPTVVEHHRFGTNRENFKDLATQAALNLLRRTLPSQE